MAVQVIAGVNTFFWILFFLCCTYQFKQLLRFPAKYPVHGVILLSTVATQSIVIVWTESYPSLSRTVMLIVLGIGIIFYIFGICLLGMRYKRRNQWSLVEDWTNTNCIIHGALSITGLALVPLQFLSADAMTIFWLIVFSLLLIVEGMEVTRAVLRVRSLGWKKGIFTYHVSQWSRNFTFGMFYAFTMMMHESSRYPSVLYDFQASFLTVWAWVVLAVLLAEIGIWGVAVKEQLRSPSSLVS